ncbi:MAG TPA: DUF1289 domain-containing protein [Stellaceae bacterium]|nr:DUF1289 domain-containing protein [Stellaceae bacterium]
MSERAPVSPCVGVCTLDPVTHFCVGCARSIAEIAEWPRLGPEEKRRIIAALSARRSQARGRHAQSGLAPG